MKRPPFILLSLALLFTIGFFVKEKIYESSSKIAELRNQHQGYLDNSPFKENLKLTKAERKAKGLPPNKYMERQWELTMDPRTGKPEPKRLFQLQEELKKNALFAKVPGESQDQSWKERGPNNVGGRTRALMFDPNDETNGYKRAFAGGVSGGLWVNNDITDENSTWSEVNIPQNLAISSITYDPNNTMTFYVGTGESYVQGSVNGNGLWKSIDGGANWLRVFGGITGETTFVTNAKITVNSPALIAGEYQVTTAGFGPDLISTTGDLVLVDDGSGSPSLGCDALTNGGDITGNIAVVERGDCTFITKVKNAQDAGAIGVLIINNAFGPPIPLGGTDSGTITIPSVMVSRDEGQAILDQLGSGVNITMEPVSSSVSGNFVTPGIQHINDVKVRDLGSGNSEIYVAVGGTFYKHSNPFSLFGNDSYGLYKSVDNGGSWSKVTLPISPSGFEYEPNDIDFGSDNAVWVSTKNNRNGDGGGTILSSIDGIAFSVKKTITNGKRTQIAISADTIYVLAETSGTNGVEIVMTTDAFATDSSLTLPDDKDDGIPATDFTRGQGYYNLLLEVDPSDPLILYVGGIDLFRSMDSGTNWTQISKWSNNSKLNSINAPLVHADQHALNFRPGGNTNMAIIGNDGGVYYASSLSGAFSNSSAISARNNDYNTLQFYKGGIGSEELSEKLIAGAQDNGVQLINNATTGINESNRISGGDGAYVFIDKDNEYMISSYVYNNYYYMNYDDGSFGYEINDRSSGNFINPAALDSENDILYSNGSINGGVRQIYKYTLGENAAVIDSISNDMLNGSPTAFKASTFATKTTLFVGTDNGRLLKVENANSTPTWTNITGSDFYGSISCVELGETENDILVTFFNYGVASVYYTSDGGQNWINKEGDLPDLPVTAVMMNPLNPKEVILGTDLGVWATSDFSVANPTWFQSQNGMKDVKVTSFDMRTSDNTVLASTYGRGLFTGVFSLDPDEDSDGDGVLNGVDNCPTVANADQADSDNNGVGDVCQDTDNDGVLDVDDNCPLNYNPDQADVDNNGIGDTCEDSDGDGINDSEDNCVEMANPDQIDLNDNGIGDVCDTSYTATDNFTLEIISETCPGLNNGTINISVNETFVSYTATLTGSGLDLNQAFSTNMSFEDIPVGSYLVCVEVDGRDYKQCFEINIDAAEALNLDFSKKGSKSNIYSVNVNQGTAPFEVSLNGEFLQTVNTYSFDVVIDGFGLLEIVSAKSCEGVFKTVIEGSLVDGIVASPNPVSDNLTITIPNSKLKYVSVQVLNVLGQQVYKESVAIDNNRIRVSFKNFKRGIYFIKADIDGPVVLKIIKQ